MSNCDDRLKYQAKLGVQFQIEVEHYIWGEYKSQFVCFLLFMLKKSLLVDWLFAL